MKKNELNDLEKTLRGFRFKIILKEHDAYNWQISLVNADNNQLIMKQEEMYTNPVDAIKDCNEVFSIY